MKYHEILDTPEKIAKASKTVLLAPVDIIHEVIIRPYKSTRSLSQNRLLHSWCGQISQELAEATGRFYPAEQWKIYLKSLFLGEKSVEVNGKVITTPISTADLKVDEFRKFLEDIDHYCGAELQIILSRTEDYSMAVYGKRAQ